MLFLREFQQKTLTSGSKDDSDVLLIVCIKADGFRNDMIGLIA